MNPQNLLVKPLLLALAISGMTLMLVSWDNKRVTGHYQQSIADTTPKNKTNREKKVRDLDDVLDELNNVDMEKINKDVFESLKNFDSEKVSADINKALKEIDFNKLQKEVNESMSKIDWDKIQKEVESSMAKIDWDQMKKNVDASIAGIDWKKIQEQMENVKKLNLDKLDLQMDKIGEQLKDLGPQMEKAKIEIEKAKADVQEFKEFVDGLAADGLIDKKAEYTLRHKDGELMINGKKASDATYNKYHRFLEKHPKFKIEKTADDFDMDMD